MAFERQTKIVSNLCGGCFERACVPLKNSSIWLTFSKLYGTSKITSSVASVMQISVSLDMSGIIQMSSYAL